MYKIEELSDHRLWEQFHSTAAMIHRIAATRQEQPDMKARLVRVIIAELRELVARYDLIRAEINRRGLMDEVMNFN